MRQKPILSLGICRSTDRSRISLCTDPRRIWRCRTIPFSSSGHSGRNPSIRWQCRRLPCANVYHGNRPSSWVRSTKAKISSRYCRRQLTTPGIWCDRTQQWNRYHIIANPPPKIRVITTLSMARKSGPQEQNIPI